MKAAVPAESYILFIIFHYHLYAPAMSTASNQVGKKIKELSVNTVAFISCRSRLTKVLAGAAKGEKGSKSG